MAEEVTPTCLLCVKVLHVELPVPYISKALFRKPLFPESAGDLTVFKWIKTHLKDNNHAMGREEKICVVFIQRETHLAF